MNSAEAAARSDGATERYFRALVAGLICGFLAVIQSAGFGLLLFGGGMHALSPVAVSMALYATAVATVVAVFTGSLPGTVSITQTVPIAALAGGVAPILAATGGAGGSPAAASTLVAFVGLGSFTFAALAFGLGRFQAARFIRFIPYPVMAGFFAGAGILIMRGGFGIATGHRLDSAGLSLLVLSSVEFRIGATLVLVGAITVLVRRYAPSIVLPSVAAAGWLAYLVVALALGYDTDAARVGGWLVNYAREGAAWPPVPLSDLGLVDWAAIAGSLHVLPAVALLSVMTVAMNVSAIEMALRRDLDLDRELRSVGLQNLVGGIGGGLLAFHSVPLTLLGARFRVPGTWTGLVVAAICVGALVTGHTLLGHVPTPVLAAMVVWVGLSLTIDWLIRSFARVPLWEYGVVLLIVAVILVDGLVTGLVVGLVAAAVLFVVEYGRVEIVRHVITGRDYQSATDASEQRLAALRTAGDAILIVRLQGYLFFGTADRMRRRIQTMVEAAEGTPIRYVLLDFTRVNGVDSSTAISFVRLAQATRPAGFTLVPCGISPPVRAAMDRAGFGPGGESAVVFAEDFDRGLAWCESALLAAVAPDIVAGTPVAVRDILAMVVGDAATADVLMPYLDRLERETGDTLIAEGAASSDLYFLEAGRAAVTIASPEGALRLATVGPGSIVGEMAFYRGGARVASVVAEEAIVAWQLSASSILRLEAERPAALIRFHRGMARLLAERLAGANRLVRLLSD